MIDRQEAYNILHHTLCSNVEEIDLSIALEALEKLAPKPGYVLVPVEPTDEMLDAGVAMALNVTITGQGGWTNYIRGLYKQMLAAAQGSTGDKP